jgi:hypothetical protein
MHCDENDLHILIEYIVLREHTMLHNCSQQWFIWTSKFDNFFDAMFWVFFLVMLNNLIY